MSGKGDTARPVDGPTYRSNHERIFPPKATRAEIAAQLKRHLRMLANSRHRRWWLAVHGTEPPDLPYPDER